MKTKWTIVMLLFLCTSLLSSANGNDKGPYPKDFFRPPVEGEVRLSGTFGELRSNHFHSGIDIKGYRGRPIVAAADAYVYRIMVRAGGYGNALYLKHSNGYITLYGHLNSFIPKIADFVKDWQYDNESFEMDIKPDSTLFVFKKGEKIGTMGNTGYSFGPHLHFEIRTADDKPVNPLHCSIEVVDRRPPLMNQVRVYGLNKNSLTTSTQTYNLQSKGRNQYSTNKDTIMVPADQAGVAVKTYDLMDAVRNWNGVYQIKMLVDGEERYNFAADEFTFDEWQYLNAHVDYADVRKNKSYFNKCFQMPGNHFSGYQDLGEKGILKPRGDKAQRVEIISTDIKGNQSIAGFWIKRAQGAVKKRNTTFNYLLPYNQENQINNYYLYLKFPKGTFYEDLEMNYHFEQEEGPNLFSTVHSIHDDLTPLHNSFLIRIRPNLIPEHLHSKAFIAKCDDDNEITNCGGEWKNGKIETRVGSFGDYAVMIDTVPPIIKVEDFQYNLQGRKSINFKAEDDIGRGGRAKGLRYKATIDGQWVLLTYDLKYDRFTYRFDERVKAGEHTFRMEITDDRDNVAVFEKKFIR